MIETFRDTYMLNLEAPDHKVWDVSEFLYGSVQVALFSGAWGSAVVTVQVSNDGANWSSLPVAVTFSADGISATIDVSGYAFLRVRTTTNAGAAGEARVIVNFARETE